MKQQWRLAPLVIASLVIAPLLAWGSWAHAASPTVQELVAAIQRHHPEYLATLARTEQVAGERLEAEAAFDVRLVQDTYARSSGYYDGSYAEQRVIQPIQSMNAEVFGSYRISDGEFPVYEAEYQTLDMGEASLGVRLSLLQNRETDKRRLTQVMAAWRFMEAESKQLAELNKLIYKGVSAYLSWYQSYRKVAVVKDLVALTRERITGVQARVLSGDLAAINLTEFETTLLRRQLMENEAEQQFQLARQRLSYFWRTADSPQYQGDAVDIPPSNIDWPFRVEGSDASSLSTSNLSTSGLEATIDAHPAVEALSAKVEQAKNKRKLARNETLPQLDLEVKVARDIGDGIEPLTGTESIVGLSFFMPLGQRAAKAREAIADAEIRSLEYDQIVLREQLRRDLDMSLKALTYTRRILALSRQQEALAETLLRQERARFDEGVSDQFLLISRETTALQAHLKTVDAEVEVLRQELALNATLASLQPSLPHSS